MIIADELRTRFEPVDPWTFYHEIFGDGSLDEAEAFTKGKYNAIALEITKEKGTRSGKNIVKRYTITNDLDAVDYLTHSNNFCIMAPISYAGKSRKSENARVMYALCVELDELRVNFDRQEGLWNLVYQWDGEGPSGLLPRPTFCVASGSGIHLYYVFEKPLVLFPNVVKGLIKYKKELTQRIWNKYTTYAYKKENIQFESIFQAFRIPGTITKKGERAEAFRTGEKVSIEYMNKFIPESYRKKGAEIPGAYKSNINLAEAKQKWPEWFERRIVNKDKTVRKWDIAGKVNGDNPYALYDWWYKKIVDGALVGKRYYCLLMLVIYAIKNDVPEERLREDCYKLLDHFEALTSRPERYASDRKKTKLDKDNHFTAFDVECALQAYEDSSLYTYPINSIMNRAGIEIVKNKRNGRKQKVHLAAARAVQNVVDPGNTWRNRDGRPKGSGTAQEKILEWRAVNPDGTKKQCKDETGLTYPTLRKWWDTKIEETRTVSLSKDDFDLGDENLFVFTPEAHGKLT